MTIIRVSAAELFSKPHEFSPEEKTFLDGLTDEEIEKRALADPDAQPSTPEMIRRGQENRRSRLRLEALRDLGLGAKLTKAAPELELPIFELTDEHGRKVLLKAADCRRVTELHDPAARILKLEAVVAQPVPQTNEHETDVPAGMPEKQTT